MGRPLLSTLIAPLAPVVRVAEPSSKLPEYERWSYLNAFDPDADEFFEGENVVYEAFLSPEEIAERENTPTTRVEVEVSTQAVNRSGSDVLSLTMDDSSSGSDTSSSGRTSPAETDQLLLGAARLGEPDWGLQYNIAGLEIPTNFGRAPMYARSLPTTPTRATWLAGQDIPVSIEPADEIAPSPSAPVDIPASPMPHPAQAVPSPMTPPGSVTPRFLSWASVARPRAIDMSASPTPAAPLGSVRASRMSVSYISPPALRVLQ